MLTEDYTEIIDLSGADLVAPEHRAELRRWLALTESHSPRIHAIWGLEDVEYWNENVYSSPEQVFHLPRRGAGLRMMRREQHLFQYLRPHITGGIVIDIGCGMSQAVRMLGHPDTVGYHYIGCDLSLNALIANTETMEGDFVQCSASDPPFLRESASAVLMLGVLHHMPSQSDALRALLDLLEPGGLIGLHEVTKRRPSPEHRHGESAHNESVNPDDILNILGERMSVLVTKFEYSRVAWLAIKLMPDAIRKSPHLTKLLLHVDDAFNSTVGRVIPSIGSSAVLILARSRQGAQTVRTDLDASEPGPNM